MKRLTAIILCLVLAVLLVPSAFATGSYPAASEGELEGVKLEKSASWTDAAKTQAEVTLTFTGIEMIFEMEVDDWGEGGEIGFGRGGISILSGDYERYATIIDTIDNRYFTVDVAALTANEGDKYFQSAYLSVKVTSEVVEDVPVQVVTFSYAADSAVTTINPLIIPVTYVAGSVSPDGNGYYPTNYDDAFGFGAYAMYENASEVGVYIEAERVWLYRRGSLTVTKMTDGAANPANPDYMFSVTANGAPYSGSYTVSGTGAPSGTQTAAGGVITLKAGQVADLGSLEAVTYQIVEILPDSSFGDSYAAKHQIDGGAVVNSADTRAFSLSAAAPTSVVFTNTYTGPIYGGLIISNTVTGKTAAADAFRFTVEFGDDTAEYTCVISASAATARSLPRTIQVKSGDSIVLQHGETAQIFDIPAGTTYKVTETKTDASFATQPATLVLNGTIEAGKFTTADFVNTYTEPAAETPTATTPTATTTIPQTGDGSYGSVALLVLALGAVAKIAYAKKREFNA